MSGSRPSSQGSNQSMVSVRSRKSNHPTEATPLLSQGSEASEGNDQVNGDAQPSAAPALPRSLSGGSQQDGKRSRRWPSVLALAILCLVVIMIMVVGFFAPAVMEEYALQAVHFEPTSLSVDSFTASGIRARVQGDFTMDASRVKKKAVRDLGRFGTWIARDVESGYTNLSVSLPEYGNLLLGTAQVPPIKVRVRNGHSTHIDFLTDLQPGSKEGIRRIANDWLEGRLGQLRVQGKADVKIKSGIFSLGKQTITQSMVFEGDDIPEMPNYNITSINFHEVRLPDASKGMAADVVLTVQNDYPVDFEVPELGFAVLVDNCSPEEPYIMLADATTGVFHVKPKQDIQANVTGIVRRLPEALTTICPTTHRSPLDALVGGYIRGNDTVLFVRGSDSPSLSTPKWITELIHGITVPVPFPGHTFGRLIRDFSLADVHFHLPAPFADPDSPQSQPQISAKVRALVSIPNEIGFPIGVDRVRADADVYYKNQKLGRLDLRKWQKANATKIDKHGEEEGGLLVESAIEKAPLQVTDDDVFADVVQALVFGGKMIYLTVKAKVDVEIETALGKFAVREIPAEGTVPIKPISKGGFGSGSPFALHLSNLKILSTGVKKLKLQGSLNITNPTNYSATVPYMNVNVLTNGTLLGNGTVENVVIVPGVNDNITVETVWDPFSLSGEKGLAVGSEFLSMYISGLNTTLTIKTHDGSIPSQPALGRALKALEINLPTPKLGTPKTPAEGGDDEEDDGKPHFIKDATMHLITSTAIFTLLSPFQYTTLYITHINATAFYHDDDVGRIEYNELIEVPPGASKTPRLPVQWSLGSVGYDAIKNALGGSLKLSARATVGVRIGEFEDTVWFVGSGIGAQVRL